MTSIRICAASAVMCTATSDVPACFAAFASDSARTACGLEDAQLYGIHVADDRDASGQSPPREELVDERRHGRLRRTLILVQVEQHLADLPKVGTDRSFDGRQRCHRARRIGQDARPERLQLEDGAGHRLGQSVMDAHRPSGALFEHKGLHRLVDGVWRVCGTHGGA
jgi:hypothetical protein